MRRLLVFLITFGLLGLLACFTFLGKISPRNADKFPVLVRIQPEQNIRAILDTLQTLGIIQETKPLRYYLTLLRWDRKIHSGTYLFSKPLRTFEVARILASGRVAQARITLPEGLTYWEVRDALSKHLDIDSLEWETLIYDPELCAKWAMGANSLEGFLFPDTYLFPLDYSAKEVVETMLHRFWQIHGSLSKATGPGVDSLQTITMASIVQKEDKVEAELPVISGVFYNRLRLGWPLGADPTVRYYLRRLDGALYKDELHDDHPYNTRTRLGLPPGPISNAGKKAILAAINPQKTSYMYFVAKDDGSGEHFFTSTNAEHNARKAIRKVNRDKRGTNPLGN